MSRLRLRHLWIVVPFWALAIKATVPLTEDRFLTHVRLGMDQLATGEVLRVDRYSFTQFGTAWRSPSWLADVTFGRLEAWVPELSWVAGFVFVVAAATLGVVLVGAATQHPSLAGLGAVIAVTGWMFLDAAEPGSALVGYLLLAVLTLIVVSPTERLWVVPGVMWLWAAVDPSFIIGLALLGADAARKRTRRSVAAAGLAVVAASLTAHGLRLWETVGRGAVEGWLLDGVHGWQPPDFTSVATVPFLAMLAALMFGLATQRIEAGALWILVPATLAGIVTAPLVFPAVIVMSPWLARAVGGLPRAREEDSSADRWMVGVTLAALLVSGVVILVRPVRLSGDRFPPRDAVAMVTEGPVYHELPAAGGLMYAFGRERPVVIDGRIGLYDAGFVERHASVTDAIGWESFFAQWDIHQALISPLRPLARELLRRGWATCHADRDFVVLVESGCREGV